MNAPNTPLRTVCEGSWARGHRVTADESICTMCGHQFPTLHDGELILHERLDLIAMIERGDFG
jgi:hypothetical protein